MSQEQYDKLPLPVFIASEKNGRILFANELAQKRGIQANADLYNMIEDKALFHKIIKDRNKPLRKKTVLNVDEKYFHAVIDINNVDENGESALLMLISEMVPSSLLNEKEIIEQVCEAFILNDKNPIYDFLRITARSVGAFCAALYEKKNGRYTICDEWRERRCVCVPMLSADVERNATDEMTRLLRLKRADDIIFVPYQKKYGTQGVAIYFFQRNTDVVYKDRIKKYLNVYLALAPDAPANNLNAVKKGLELVEQGIAIWDADSKELIFQNKVFREKFGSGSAKLLTSRIFKDNKPEAGESLIYSDSAGRYFCMSNTKTRSGRRKLVTTVISDITRYKKAENRLEALARTDALTGLSNRRAGLEILESLYKQCKKDGSPLTVCFADIDGLKKINDTYGHGVGDNMIRTVAGILRKQLDGTGHVCRLGGDEFVLILPGNTKAQAMLLTSQIEKAVNKTFLNDSQTISVSFGFKEAEYSTDETSLALLNIADMEMYREKQRKA